MFTKLTTKFLSFWKLPVKEKAWFFMLYPYSGIIRAAILILPFTLLSRTYGKMLNNDQLCIVVSEEQKLLAWRLGRITEMTAKYTPWESKCLVQAIMVRTLLEYYKIPYIMHLGAKLSKDGSDPMKAHAWVKVGPWIITGREGHKTFGIVGTYVSPFCYDSLNTSEE